MMHALRRFAALLVILPLTALLAWADAPARSGPPAQWPDPRPVAVVTLGDSTLAGEGAGDYIPGTRGEHGNFCRRSSNATVHWVALPEATLINLACSGARAAHVGFDVPPDAAETSQAVRLGELAGQYRISAVVLAVGANDAPSFGEVVLRCVQAGIARWTPPCSTELAGEWVRRVEVMVPEVEAALADVRTAMRAANYPDGSYDLVVQSYAAPVTELLAPELQSLAGCPFRTEDLLWVRTVAVPQLSEALRGVADRAGARFLDLSRAAEGHEACTSPTDPGDEWITRLSLDFQLLQDEQLGGRAAQESFHPNAAGHERIAGCLSEFLRMGVREASCRVGPDGLLHPVRIPAEAR